MRNEIGFRLAGIHDAKRLAAMHLQCGAIQAESFMPKLGIRFMTAYYRVLISSRFSVILMAYRLSDNECIGFHSGTTDAAETQAVLVRSKIYLAFVALFALAARPQLLIEIFKRYRAVIDKEANVIINFGPRGEYWAWKPGAPPVGGAIEIHNRWHHLMFALGCTHVRSEVNVANDKVRRTTLAMGGKFIAETKDLNGMARLFVEINLSEYCSRYPLAKQVSDRD